MNKYLKLKKRLRGRVGWLRPCGRASLSKNNNFENLRLRREKPKKLPRSLNSQQRLKIYNPRSLTRKLL
jgi:hypothetical protein